MKQKNVGRKLEIILWSCATLLFLIVAIIENFYTGDPYMSTFVFVLIIVGIVTGRMAKNRGYHSVWVVFWILSAVMFSPLLCWILLAIFGNIKEKKNKSLLREQEEKTKHIQEDDNNNISLQTENVQNETEAKPQIINSKNNNEQIIL